MKTDRDKKKMNTADLKLLRNLNKTLIFAGQYNIYYYFEQKTVSCECTAY